MDQLLAGEDSINVEDWQDHTLYKDCSESDAQIQWFWDLIASYDQSQLEAMLAFVTCSPAPPTGQLLCHYCAFCVGCRLCLLFVPSLALQHPRLLA